MGGSKPCFSKKDGLRKGGWTDVEDQILSQFVSRHGVGAWSTIPSKAGLRRCGKSCRLRWLNYLRPDLIRGNITPDEESLIVRLHKLLGNRWSLIAGRLPGRSDNEIKNYWNTKLKKKVQNGHYRDIFKAHSCHCPSKKSKDSKYNQINENGHKANQKIKGSSYSTRQVIYKPKAIKCTKVYIDPLYNLSTMSVQQQQLPPLSPINSVSKLHSFSSTLACENLETKDPFGFDFNVDDFDLAHLYDFLYYCGGSSNERCNEGLVDEGAQEGLASL